MTVLKDKQDTKIQDGPFVDPGQNAFGIWNGGHFMHFGSDIGRERLIRLIQNSYDLGIRTFMTADVYGEGEADRVLGRALSGVDRKTYCLVGAVGHDFYKGVRQGEKGYPRFTDPLLRSAAEYGAYLQMAAEKSLQRLEADSFDLLLLHNPDSTGYTHEAVWEGLSALQQKGLTRLLGLAPGPANGFTLDVIHAFEKFHSRIDWAMIILNPLEPWPGSLVLPAAEKHGIHVIARVVEYGGLFHDSLKSGAALSSKDHRSFRPAGWVEAAQGKLDQFRDMAQAHDMTLLQLACRWTLAQKAVRSVVPTLIQESGADAKPIETQARELAGLSGCKPLTPDTVLEMARLGDNKNSMALKGGSSQYLGKPQADQWPLTPELKEAAGRWGIVPDRDLYYPADARDLREISSGHGGAVQACEKRLFLQLQVFGGCRQPDILTEALKASGLESVLYLDASDPGGVGVLILAEDPEIFTGPARLLLSKEPFSGLKLKPEFTMTGRTYATGREADLEDWLLVKPRRNALNPQWRWAIWYPLRRKPEFALLPKQEQGKILSEHAMIGRNFAQAGYAADIRLACHGLDKNDNEFVLGLLGPELYPLSRLVQEMRKTQQTARYIQSLGPFFTGRVHWQSSFKVTSESGRPPLPV